MTIANSGDGDASYVEEDRQIPVRDGSSITVRLHKPKNPSRDGCPIFVVYHGGGYCLGGLDNEVLLCRKFTELGGIAVNVDYRLAPEHPFPVPIEDAYDALKWVCALQSKLGILCLLCRPPRISMRSAEIRRKVSWSEVSAQVEILVPLFPFFTATTRFSHH